jgi:hypothetical protein
MKYYEQLRWAVWGALLSGVFAFAQIKSGTIIVFDRTPSDFFIAADSRANYDDASPPDDNECKISAFQSSHVIFAASGVTGYISSESSDSIRTWSAHDQVKISIPQKWPKPIPADAKEALSRLTTLWASRMKDRWQKTFLAHPEILRSVSTKQRNGVLTKGIFALAFKRQIAIAMVEMMYTESGVTAVFHNDMNCWAGITFCAMGETEIALKYVSLGSFMLDSDQLSRVTRLAELTVSEDKSGEVGGPIDAVEMSNDGTITWRQKKEVCPESRN